MRITGTLLDIEDYSGTSKGDDGQPFDYSGQRLHVLDGREVTRVKVPKTLIGVHGYGRGELVDLHVSVQAQAGADGDVGRRLQGPRRRDEFLGLIRRGSVRCRNTGRNLTSNAVHAAEGLAKCYRQSARSAQSVGMVLLLRRCVFLIPWSLMWLVLIGRLFVAFVLLLLIVFVLR
jgi:hypothetical protein